MPGSQKNASKPKCERSAGEAVALDAVASGEHPRHGRLEIVVADAPRHPAEAPEGDRMSLEERLLALAREADVDRPS